MTLTSAKAKNISGLPNSTGSYLNAKTISSCLKCASSSTQRTASVSITLYGRKRLFNELRGARTTATGAPDSGHDWDESGGFTPFHTTTTWLIDYTIQIE